MVKKTPKKNSTDEMVKRLSFVKWFATILFFCVVIHLVYIQFVQGEELKRKAYNNQNLNQLISPNRGTIYDAKGEVLAQSIAVDTVSLNPGMLVYSNNKDVPNNVVAEGLSKIFNVTYEEMIEKLESGKSVVIVERKVDKDKVDKLKKWMAENKITAGINVDGDSKRFYPYNNLASNLIGFCGTENTGRTGLEERWNRVLTGTAGKVVTTVDLHKNPISDEDEQYIASEDGSNIYLTTDVSIQSTAEKYLEQALQENPTAKSGTCIIMNPQNGDIYAMASNPTYNLNEPSSFAATGYTEDEWKALTAEERSASLLNLWKNKAVSGTYEPGSTFKLITAAVGLEEGLVVTDKAGDFYCSGSYVVDPDEKPINCWRAIPHESQTLRDALQNSCNPAFMQLGQRIGASTLYKYFKAFGLFNEVGSDIAKAYNGTFYDLSDMGPVELATTSFGQRFEISPLQLISAISAICNEGVYVEPRIVNKVENTDIGSIEIIETKNVRQVISKETADKVKDMMQSVVVKGTGRQAAVEGYSIGGKSGTSEPIAANIEEGYVASFIAASPIENTQVVVLFMLEGLSKEAEHQGGTVAGPYVAKILGEVLPYLGVASTANTKEEVKEDKLVSIPNVKDKSINEATALLQNLGFKVVAKEVQDPNATLVFDQVPKYGTSLEEGSVIYLYTSADEERNMVKVPNIKGMKAKEAANTLKSHNLNINIDGTEGVVITQDPIFDTEVEAGSVIDVVIKKELVDAH